MPSLLCATVPCTSPALVRCEACTEAYCGAHFSGGSSSRCGRCFRTLVRESTATDEARREAASQAASW